MSPCFTGNLNIDANAKVTFTVSMSRTTAYVNAQLYSKTLSFPPAKIRTFHRSTSLFGIGLGLEHPLAVKHVSTGWSLNQFSNAIVFESQKVCRVLTFVDAQPSDYVPPRRPS